MVPTALEVLEQANEEAILAHAVEAHARELEEAELFEQRVGEEIRRIVALVARQRPGTAEPLTLCALSVDEWRARLCTWCEELVADGESDEPARGLIAYLEDADDTMLWVLLDSYVCDVRARLRVGSPPRVGR